jgi:hypothetical protein
MEGRFHDLLSLFRGDPMLGVEAVSNACHRRDILSVVFP